MKQDDLIGWQGADGWARHVQLWQAALRGWQDEPRHIVVRVLSSKGLRRYLFGAQTLAAVFRWIHQTAGYRKHHRLWIEEAGRPATLPKQV